MEGGWDRERVLIVYDAWESIPSHLPVDGRWEAERDGREEGGRESCLCKRSPIGGYQLRRGITLTLC